MEALLRVGNTLKSFQVSYIPAISLNSHFDFHDRKQDWARFAPRRSSSILIESQDLLILGKQLRFVSKLSYQTVFSPWGRFIAHIIQHTLLLWYWIARFLCRINVYGIPTGNYGLIVALLVVYALYVESSIIPQGRSPDNLHIGFSTLFSCLLWLSSLEDS